MSSELSLVSAFLAVAEERSFTRAANQLGLSPSALSHAIRRLEERVGVRLLARSTRSVALTSAGAQLIAHVRPSFHEIRTALDQVATLRSRPAGRVRLAVSPFAGRVVLAPKLGQFAREFPDVVLEVTTMHGRLDLVASGFDAGIHLGELIERDMIAVRVSADQRVAVVGSPAYFSTHPPPGSPRELMAHRCINFHTRSGIYRWDFKKHDVSIAVVGDGPLIVEDTDIAIRAAIDGLGVAFMVEEQAAPHLVTGALVRVLHDWCPPIPGYFLYYPSRRHQPAALVALINTLRVTEPCRAGEPI